MAIIKPYSSLLLTANATDFPALKHAWEYTGLDFDTDILTDSVGGTTCILSNPVDNGNGSWTGGGGSYAGVSLTGTVTSPGTSPVVVIAVTKNLTSVNNGFSIGDNSSSATFGMSGGTGFYVTIDGSNYFTEQASVGETYNGDYAAAIAVGINWSGDAATKYYYDSQMSNTHSIAYSATLGAITTGISSVNQAVQIANAADVVGFYYFIFTTLPTDIAAATAWMAENPGYIYPGWRYVS